MHSLQCDKTLGWDDILAPQLQKEWKNICVQANAAPCIEIPRYIGPKDGEYYLYAFTDASQALYGNVVYLLHVESGKLSFVTAKNRMIGSQLKGKSIPSLELNAISLGVETLMDVYNDLSGPSCLKPIKITELFVYTDSLCCLHWLNSAVNKVDKLNKLSVFVRNRLQDLQNMCDKIPIKFKFTAGENNPADCVTRCMSYKQIKKSNFLTGPDVNAIEASEPEVIIPNPLLSTENSEHSYSPNNPIHNFVASIDNYPSILNPCNFSSFLKLLYLYRRVLLCIQVWKMKTFNKNASELDCSVLYAKATKLIIKADQRANFLEILKYFQGGGANIKDIPSIVSKFNVFLDQDGILRVKCKFQKWSYNANNTFPILLSKSSELTKIIILDIHRQLAHSGCYAILSELRKHFFIPQQFSAVKNALKTCFHCRRFNSRTIKINQSDYRDFRFKPPQIPFANVFVDYLGPFSVKKNNINEKVWLLCITCTWTRAVNLKLAHDLSLKEFLRTFQLHCYEFGLPQLFISDLGSQLTAGINTLRDFLNDPEIMKYFDYNNVKPTTFQQYFKGCSQLGSLVEVVVKMVKRLIFGSIKNIIDILDFELLINYVIHLINRRPIAFKEEMRCAAIDNVPEPITPELLIRGFNVTSINTIPELHTPTTDPTWQTPTKLCDVRNSYVKLQKIQLELRTIYSNEFLRTLIAQAVDKKDRYKPVSHKGLNVGDIVLLKEVNTKPNHYPLGIIKQTVVNNNGEVTGALVLKGRTRECVKRHASSLIPMLQVGNEDIDSESQESTINKTPIIKRPTRKAAEVSRQQTKDMLTQEDCI